MTPTINIPDQALVDEVISINLAGFEPKQHVTLRVNVTDDFGRAWSSYAVFQTDSQGNVNVASQKPIDGTYDGADATGLFWSLRLAPGEKVDLPVLKNGTAPSEFTFTADADGQTVATATFRQLYIADGVTQHEVREDGLVGIYFKPAGEGLYPAVLVVTGSGGGLGVLDVNKAALLASHGYAALYLAYFNYDGLPPQLVNIPLEYFEKGIRWLQSQEGVDKEKIGVWGISRGGELALLLGATFPQIKVVLAYAPSGLVWPGFSGDPQVVGAAWTQNDHPITPVDDSKTPPEFQAEMFAAVGTETIYPNTRLLLAAYQHAPNIDEAVIPVEKINGAVLLVSGKDDAMWPSNLLANIAYDRLKQHNHPHPYKHLEYADVGHFILLPSSPTTADYIVHPVVPIRLALGGTPRQNAFANADSWANVKAFLQQNFGY